MESKPNYWRKLISEQEARGQQVRSFCRERGIGKSSFYRWRRRLQQSVAIRAAGDRAGNHQHGLPAGHAECLAEPLAPPEFDVRMSAPGPSIERLPVMREQFGYAMYRMSNNAREDILEPGERLDGIPLAAGDEAQQYCRR